MSPAAAAKVRTIMVIGSLHPCPNWAWLTLLDPLFAHYFCFRSVEGQNGFDKGLGIVLNTGGELAPDSDPLFLLLHGQKLGDQPRRLFYQAQIPIQDGKNWAKRHLISRVRYCTVTQASLSTVEATAAMRSWVLLVILAFRWR